MKDVLVFLILLNTQIIKVCLQPYQPDSNGNCRDSTTEYVHEGLRLCCKKCQPGQRLIQFCTETTDSVCKPCEPEQYMGNWNYAGNCLSCAKCKEAKGLQYAHRCNSTTNAKCTCQPGRYCILGFNKPYCSDCHKYNICKVGLGVSVPGTANSNVKCAPCLKGTFSDTVSYKDPCRPHTDCHGRAVVKKGNATSDTVCKPEATKEPRTTGRTMSTVSEILNSKPTRGPTNSGFSIIPSTSPPPPIALGITLAIIGVVTLILLFIALILLFVYKPICKKDAARLHPKVDANGNCDSSDKGTQGCLEEAHLTLFTVTSPEQQCLLERGEACSNHSQCTINTETLTRTEGSSSHESIGPLQSTAALNNQYSALSEPMPLISNREPVIPLPSTPTQSVISPVTTSPHVNVNITFHIGNGSCGGQSAMPTDSMQADANCKLPLGEEEESFSIPQQEDGKQSLMSVQERDSYSL